MIKDDPNHDVPNVLRQIAGGCQGFVSDFAQTFPQSSASERSEVMGYYPHGFLSPAPLADSLPVCDRWFSSLPGPTWPNRFFVHSGTCLGHVTMPQGVWHPNLHIYDQVTVYDRLEERGISWKIYYGDVPQSLVLTRLWQHPFAFDQLAPFSLTQPAMKINFLSTALSNLPILARSERSAPSHRCNQGRGTSGPGLQCTAIECATMEFHAIVVLYDEHGGFADHVYPTATLAPDNHTEEFAFNQFGVRIPAILVSPWFDAGEIRTTFDHTSLLKYLTDKWSLGR